MYGVNYLLVCEENLSDCRDLHTCLADLMSILSQACVDRVVHDSVHSMDLQAFIEMFVYLNKQSKHVWWSPKHGSSGSLSGDSLNWSFLTFPWC